jgi:hypothetical protein
VSDTGSCRRASRARLIAREKARAEITHTHLGFPDPCNSLNREALEPMFAHDLRDWRKTVNHFPATGERKHLR